MTEKSNFVLYSSSSYIFITCTLFAQKRKYTDISWPLFKITLNKSNTAVIKVGALNYYKYTFTTGKIICFYISELLQK